MTYPYFAGITLTLVNYTPRQLRDCRGTRPTHWLLYPMVKDKRELLFLFLFA